MKIEGYKEFKLRDMSKFHHANDGTRTLFESIAYPEVQYTLNDWKDLEVDKCVLIGGIALSYYVKPRTTEDIDLLFLSEDDIPEPLVGFKRTRKGAFQHNKYQVEVVVVTPSFINMRMDMAQKIFNTSVISDGMRVASPSGLIASKLGRFNRQDQADIDNLLSSQVIDMSVFNLTKVEIERFNSIKDDLQK